MFPLVFRSARTRRVESGKAAVLIQMMRLAISSQFTESLAIARRGLPAHIFQMKTRDCRLAIHQWEDSLGRTDRRAGRAPEACQICRAGVALGMVTSLALAEKIGCSGNATEIGFFKIQL
jgi:hypothetical protein